MYAKAARLTITALVFGCLGIADIASAQAPQLSKDQRALLQAVVQAVDNAANQPPSTDASWQLHILRASDGSHYVAFSVEPPASMPLPPSRVLLYVRLATSSTGSATLPLERSAIREWLAGSRVDPRLLPRQRGFAVGEMPAMGAGTIGGRGATSVGSADLQIMELERERSRQRREDQEKQRRASLDGTSPTPIDLLPFEDVDVVRPAVLAAGTPAIQRALTAAPGEYELFVGWVDAAATPGRASVHVVRRALRLPSAIPGALRVSSIIVADQVAVREVPYGPIEQRAHPYAIGPTEITLAGDAVFTRDEYLSVAFQIINPSPTTTGRPDIQVSFRIVRVIGDREESVAALSPLRYDDSTLPPDFDVRLGHPLLAAMSAPLATLPRGAYRLRISVTDRVSGTSASSHTDFRIVGTAASLLAEAPPVGRPFRRAMALEAPAFDAVLDVLRPAAPSAALARALAAAHDRRFIDLMRDDPVQPGEQAIRVSLSAIALFAFGDAAAVPQFQRAVQLGAPPAPPQFFAGSLAALDGRDADAVTAWRAAIDLGMRSSVVAPFLVDALLRRGDHGGAAALVTAQLGGRPAQGAWARAQAATHIATGRNLEAIAVLDALLAQQPGDTDAQWLLLHALYASIVHSDKSSDSTPGTTPAKSDLSPSSRERFVSLARSYVAAGETHAVLVTEWLNMIEHGR